MSTITTAARLTQEVKEFARSKGADLVGIAPVERFAAAPEHHHPKFFMPQAKAVVVLALRINRAILRTVAKGKEHYSYCAFGFKFVNDELDMLAYHLSKFIEKQGYEAYPIPANAPRDPLFRWGLSHRHAAVAAGMGEMGWNLILLTPEFGAKQKLVSIITDAPLEGDPLVRHTICDRCYACVKICPTGALSQDRVQTFQIEGLTFEHCRQTKWKCAFGCGGLTNKGTFALTEFPLPQTRPEPAEMFHYLERKNPVQKFLEEELCTVPWCAKCLAICALHLDAKRAAAARLSHSPRHRL
jgi:epoxyqueuosine reductase QueG